jgi:hypothetical protein
MGVLEEIVATELKEAAREIVGILERINDLSDLDNRIVAYWILGTHTLASFDIYPALLLKGPPGTGKSEVMLAIEAIACEPHAFSLRNLTYPMVRDKLGECHEATAILEEGNAGPDDARLDPRLETLLSDRYARETGVAAKMVQKGNRCDHKEKEIIYFGATIIHQRTPFADGALHGRSIVIHFVKNRKRRYEDVENCAEEMEYVRVLLENLDGLEFQLPEVPVLADIPGRIFRTYKPILMIAELCGDKDFVKDISGELKRDTCQLDEDQSTEPAGLALRALVETLYRGEILVIDNVWLSQVVDTLERTHKVSLKPRQVSKLLRGLGLLVKESHGQMRVMPTPETLLKAMELAGYDDAETITDLKGKVGDPTFKNPPTSPTRPADLGTNGTRNGMQSDGKGRRGRSPRVYTDSSSTSSEENQPSASFIDNSNPTQAEEQTHRQAQPLPLPQSSGRRISIKPSDQQPSPPLRGRERRRPRR